MSDIRRSIAREKVGKGLPKPMIKKRVSGFDIGKKMIGMPAGDIPLTDAEDEAEILCINCLDRISEEVIDAHRKVCKSYSKLDLNSEDAQESVSKNIIKLRDFLFSKENPSLACDSSTILMLTRKCTLLLEQPTFKQTYETIKSLESFLANFRGNIGLKIYIKRLLSLAQDQEKVIQNINVKSRLRRVETMKKEINKFGKKPRPSPTNKSSLNIDYHKIEAIHSQVTSKYGSSGKFSESAAEDVNKFEGDLVNDQNSEGDFQKYFYSLSISLKMQFPSSDPAQTVSITKLFADANAKSIPPEHWGSFINSELKNPANWQKQRYEKRRPRKKNMAFADAIVEEDNL